LFQSCHLFFSSSVDPLHLSSFPTRRSSDLLSEPDRNCATRCELIPSARARSWSMRRRTTLLGSLQSRCTLPRCGLARTRVATCRSEEHTSELQSRENLVCRLLLEKKKRKEH